MPIEGKSRKAYRRKKLLQLFVGDRVQWWIAHRNVKQATVFQIVDPGSVPVLSELARHGSTARITRTRGINAKPLMPRDDVSYVVAVPGPKKLLFYWPPANKLEKLPDAGVPHKSSEGKL